MRKPRVSIVILTWNQVRYTLDCLKSVYGQDYKDFEIIVVDNASTDDTVKRLRGRFIKARIIQNKKNRGFAEGNNIGVRAAKGELVVLLNNDTIVDKRWLSELVAFMDKEKTTAIAMSKIYDKYCKKEFSFDYETINPLGYPIRFRFDKKKENWPFWAKGCSLIFRKDVVGEPFDKDYFLYAEDTYLSWKTRIRGFKLKLCEPSIVYHVGEASSKNIRSMKNYYMEKNRFTNFLLFYNAKNIFFLMPWMLFSAIFHNIYDIKNAGYRFKGYFWNISNFSTIMKKRKKIQKSREVGDRAITRYMSLKFFDETSIKGVLWKPFIYVLNLIFWTYCRLVFL